MNREEVYAETYRDCCPKVKGHLYNRIVDREDADDVCQEIFVDFWKALEKFRYEAKPSSLLYIIMKRRIADYLREKYRQSKQEIPRTLGHDFEGKEEEPDVNKLNLLITLTKGKKRELLLAIKKTKERECLS